MKRILLAIIATLIVGCGSMYVAPVGEYPEGVNLPSIPTHEIAPKAISYSNSLYHTFEGRGFGESRYATVSGTTADIGENGFVVYKLDAQFEYHMLNIKKDSPAWVCLPDFSTGKWQFIQTSAGDYIVRDAWKYIYDSELWFALVFWDEPGTIDSFKAYYGRTTCYEGALDDYIPHTTNGYASYFLNNTHLINNEHPPIDSWGAQVPEALSSAMLDMSPTLYHVFDSTLAGIPTVDGFIDFDAASYTTMNNGVCKGIFDTQHGTVVPLMWEENASELVAYYLVTGYYTTVVWDKEPTELYINTLGDPCILLKDEDGAHLITTEFTQRSWSERPLPVGFNYDRAEIAYSWKNSPPWPTNPMRIYYTLNNTLSYIEETGDSTWSSPVVVQVNVKDWDLRVSSWISKDNRLVFTDMNNTLYYRYSKTWALSDWSIPLIVDYNCSNPKISVIGSHPSFYKTISYMHSPLVSDDQLLLALLH